MPRAEKGNATGRRNPGEGPDLQERQGTIVGEGRGGGAGCPKKLHAPEHVHARRLRRRGGSTQAMGGKKPLAP